MGNANSEETVALNLRWQSLDELPVLPANQFAVQFGGVPGVPAADRMPDEIYLIVGHVAPPFLAANEEDLNVQLEKLSQGVEVKTYGRYVMSRGRLQELVDLLSQAIKAYDDAEVSS